MDLEQLNVLVERCRADQRQRWHSGDRVPIEAYLSSHPELAGEKECLLDLAYNEFCIQQDLGQCPAAEDYYRRFPDVADELRSRFGVGAVLSPELAAAQENNQSANRANAGSDLRPADRRLPDGPNVAVKQAEELHVRCPSCHRPIDFPEGSSLSSIACSACGCLFSLISSEETLAYAGHGPRQIANFQLLERVGVGAFGSVWKARDTQLDRIVAIKIPRREQLEDREVEQFLHEARAAAQVKHPHIVGIHEFGRVGDSLYIVSDFVDGANLRDWLTGQRLTLREAAQLCMKIAEALHEAHQAGVIHRDLKPTNIMIDRHGEPYLTDFGLAKREGGDITMTFQGQVLGTPAYMSPEQARGDSHQADRRTDIYSLGVILYELLTGERPFHGDGRMLIVQILQDEPINPRNLNSHIDPDLETICLKCLEKEPKKRYPSAQEFAEEVRRFLRGEPVQARRVGAIGRLWRWYRRHPSAPVLAAGAFSTSCAFCMILWGLVGIGIYWLGIPGIEFPTQTMIAISLLVTCVYLPGLWLGIRVLNGSIRALWVGLVLWLVGIVLCIGGLSGWLFDVPTFGDLNARVALFTLLATICLVGAALHVAAIASRIPASWRD